MNNGKGIRNSDDEIWFWLGHVEKQRGTRFSAIKYCKINDIDAKKFIHMQSAISFKKFSDPDYYELLCELGHKYRNSSDSKEKFCRDEGIKMHDLTSTITHLNYLDAIDRIQKERDSQSDSNTGMTFIEIKKSEPSSPIIQPEELQSPEILEPRNHIELTIAKGVKVIIAPNIESTKIMKIIELLKDL